MKHANKILIFSLPVLTFTLLLSIIYALVANQIYNMFSDTYEVATFSQSYSLYFYRGLSFVIPLALFSYTIRKVRNFFVFILIGLGTTALSYLIFGCFIYTIFYFLLMSARCVMRASNTTSIFDCIQIPLILPYIGFFLLSCFIEYPSLQFFTAISLFLSVIFYVAYSTLTVTDTYLSYNRKMSNLPADHIAKSSLNHVVIITSISVVLLLLFMNTAYGYTYIDLSALYNDEVIEGTEAFVTPNASGAGYSLMDMLGVGEVNPIFRAIIELLDMIMIPLTVVFVIYILARMIVGFIKDFNKTVYYKEDVIESSDVNDSEIDEYSKNIKGISRFDYSINAKIRRKYKKIIKRKSKSLPLEWETPTQIEQNANITDDKLHLIYEKARYSEDGCTKIDLEKL